MRAREGNKAIEAYRNVLREGTGFDAVIFGLTVVERMGGKECIRELINEGLGCPPAGGLL
ncbi:MAG: hypothetical protein M0R18_13170 [Deltaproteobacteria bacterium]|nr:hypothetical protein [Deltaproteobacteria bacterium]